MAILASKTKRIIFAVAAAATAATLVAGSGVFETAPARAQTPPARDGFDHGVPLPPPKGHPKLDSRLSQLASARASSAQAMQNLSRDTGVSLSGDRVRVVLECPPGKRQAALDAASDLGTVEATYGDLIQVLVPVPELEALADSPDIITVRAPYEALEDEVTSEGVALIEAVNWQAAGYNGEGVKVGVLDLGFDGYLSRQSEGELPAVTTWWAPSLGGPGSSVHGTGIAEIIHDIAPAAEIYMANFGTDVELNNAVDWLISQGVTTISCSIAWPSGGPGDGTGPIASVVDRARNAGVLWVNSAGNSAQRHWSGLFSDTNANSYLNFSGSDEGNTITVAGSVPQTIRFWMKWDDPWGASANDYALVLVDNANPESPIVADSVQNGNDDPAEYLGYTATHTGTYYIAIYKALAAAPATLHLYSSGNNFEYQVAAGSLTVPADSPNAMTVGAVACTTPTTIEAFSSRGPTKDGRTKPDLVGPDGVSTVSYGTNAFYGTSASTPHAAGAAVLVKQMYPAYTAAQIQAYLEANGVDLGAGGKDNTFGSGRLHMGDALPRAPSNLQATPTAYNRIDISWVDNASNESEFRVEGSESPGFTPVSATFTLPANSVSHADTSVRANAVYYYRVFAVNAYGSSAPSGTAMARTPALAAPTVATASATGVFFNSAVLNGNLTSPGTAPSANVSFEWGETTAYGGSTPIETRSTPGAFSATVSLLPSTTYHFRARAIGHGVAYGDDGSFTTQPGLPPAVTSDNASQVGLDSARLNGTLASLGSAGSVTLSFQWGLASGDYASETAAQTANATGPFSANITGLTPNTAYRLRARAVGAGTVYGADRTFTTLSTPPSVATGNASAVTLTSASLNASVTDMGTASLVSISFEWGLSSTALSFTTAAQSANATGPFSASVSGLSPGIAYYYRARASGQGAPVFGAVRSFTTLSTPPAVTTDNASEVAARTARLSGNLTQQGTASTVNVGFDWRATGGAWNTTSSQSYSSTGPFSFNLTGLSPDTTYEYRARAAGHGEALGQTRTFATLSSVAPSIATDNATSVGYTSAMLNLHVISYGSATSGAISFLWGAAPGQLTQELPVYAWTPGSGGAGAGMTATLTGLSPNTTYYFRARAVGDGEGLGDVISFKTIPVTPPSAATLTAGVLSSSTALLSGNLTGLGTALPVNASFQWGTASGNYTQMTSFQPLSVTGVFSATLSGLAASTTYYYRARADGGPHGLAAGMEMTFTTPAAPPPPPPPPAGGGAGGIGGGGGAIGGGGGGSPAGPGVVSLGIYTSEDGLFNLAAVARSEDGKAQISFHKGVRARTTEGSPLKSLKIVPMEDSPEAPAGWRLIGLAYEMTPDGATFSPPVTVTISYDAATMPPDTDMTSLVIAVWSGRSPWEFMDSARNASASSVSAQISHFSVYAVLGKTVAQPTPPPPAPARFSVADVGVSAATVKIGETITVSARVSNTGGSGGAYEVVFKINGAIEATRTVSVAAASSATVVFTTSRDSVGTYSVDVNGNAGSFSVQAPAPPAAPPPTQEAPAAAETAEKRVTGSVALIAGIAAAALVICGVFLAITRLRRRV